MKVPISCLRKMGVRLVVYLDDILIMNQSKQGVLTDCKCAINVLESLGFDVNYENSVLVPSSVMEYLGFTVNTIDMTLSLPKQKIQKIKELSRQVIQSNHVSIRFLSELIGNLTASIQAIFPASLHYRHLQSEKNMVLRQGGGYNTIVTLSDQAIKEVNWWVNQVEVWNRKSLINPNPAVIIQSDASKKGWGAVCEKMCIGGIWLSGESQNHINVLELLAVTYAVKAFLKEKSDLQVLVQTDNKTAMTYINKMGGTQSAQCNQIALYLWEWCLQRNIIIRADNIPGHQNLIADWESRHHLDSSSWMLNPQLFQTLCQMTIDCNVDLFADRTNAQLPTYMSWLPDPHAVAYDALLHPWNNIKGYAFPPFCLIARCLKKTRMEKTTILLIAPAWTTQPWYATLLEMSVQVPVLLPVHPQTLIAPDGQTHPVLQNESLQLVGWVVSGIILNRIRYQRTLKNYFSVPGQKEQTVLTTQPRISGHSGVWKGKLIPFRYL